MTITADQVLGLQGFERGIGARPADVTFGQVVGDNINYYLQPLAQELATGSRTFIGREFDPDFDWTQGIPDRHTPYISSYALAADAEDQARITEYIDQRIRLRERMARTPIGYQIAGEFLNPVNYLGIAFGAPIMTGGRIALARTVTRGSAAAAGTEGLINLGLEVLDPVQSTAETLMNTVSVGAFSGVFEAARTLPAIRRQAAVTSLREQAAFTARVSSRLESLDGVDASALTRITPREDREFGNVENVQETYDQYTSELRGLRTQLGTVAESSGEARLIQDRIDELEALRRPYSDEVLFRTLEEEGLDTADLFRYSAGGDTWLSRWVTNPYRRFMNSDFGSANNTVKSIMFDLASDGGVQLEFHRSGVARAASVFQESTIDLGEYIRVNDELSRLWAEDTAAPEIGSSILANVDINTTNLVRRAQGRSDSLEAWLSEVSRLRTMGEDMNSAQSRAAELLNKYFEGWEKKLIDTGQIRTRTTIARQMGNLRQEIEALEARMTQLEAKGRRVDAEETTLARRRSLLAELEAEYAMPSVAKVEPFLPRYFNTSRIRQRRDEFAEILTRWFTENPEIWSYNKTTKAWERVRLSTEPDAVARRVDETINNILQEDPSRPIEQVYTGSGRGGHLGYRSLDIPNRLVWDFIEQNPIAAMRNYTARVAPQYHFQKKFGTDRKGVVERIQKELRSAGVKERDVQAAVRDFNHLYDRVVGRVIRDPESWDQRAAALLRDATSFTYLGGAGVAALGDAGRIVMESELGTLARGSQAFFDPAIRRMSVRETRLAGAAIELNLGSAGLRMVDDQNFNFLNNARMDRIRNAFHAFNLLGPVTVLMKNFAGSLGAHMLIEYSQKLAKGTASDFEVSYLARHGIDAEMAARIADAPWQADKSSGLILPNSDNWEGNYSVPRVGDERVSVVEVNEDGSSVGKTGKNGRYVPAYYRPNEGGEGGTIYFDREYIEGEMYDSRAWANPRMDGVNPLPDDAFPTPRAWANFVMLHEIMHTRFSAVDLGLEPRSAAYENRINEMAMEAHRASMQTAGETVRVFRNALNTHVNNTVMSATPADKPIIMDGVVYIREEVGARFGLKPDPSTPGYARVENGLLALPLQFYSFTLANVNKTVGLMMQGAVRNRAIGVAAMIGMGWMISSIRTPDYVWNDMSPQDKLGRAIDMSGVAALYSDLFYTTLQTSLALGGPNITAGALQPRYPQDPNVVDAVTNVTGAASGWSADMVRAGITFARGEYGEGASDFIRNLPFSNLWFLRDDINQIGRYLSN